MDERLNEVARTGTIDALYHLIREDPSLLGRLDELQFVHTPMHVAAEIGNIHFVLEMMRLKPSLNQKLNPDGFTPIHLALQSDNDDLVIRMITFDRELIRVQGKEYSTPLHLAARKGNVKLMVDFLLACPESILDVNVRKESVLHVAVLHNQTETVKVMFDWLKLLDSEFVLGWTDEEGNTILHIAASRNDVQMIKMLIPVVDIYAENSGGERALDMIQAQTLSLLKKDRKLKIIHWMFSKRSHYNATLYCDTNNTSSVAESLKRGFPWYKRWILSNRRHISLVNKDGILVVAVLIATTAYQAIVALPTVFDNKLIARSGLTLLFSRLSVFQYCSFYCLHVLDLHTTASWHFLYATTDYSYCCMLLCWDLSHKLSDRALYVFTYLIYLANSEVWQIG